MKNTKYKHNLFQILKRFLKENRDLIKFYYINNNVREAFDNYNVSIWSSFNYMIDEKAADLKIKSWEFAIEYSGGNETYYSISERLEKWIKKNGYYDVLCVDKNRGIKFIIKKKKTFFKEI